MPEANQKQPLPPSIIDSAPTLAPCAVKLLDSCAVMLMLTLLQRRQEVKQICKQSCGTFTASKIRSFSFLGRSAAQMAAAGFFIIVFLVVSSHWAWPLPPKLGLLLLVLLILGLGFVRLDLLVLGPFWQCLVHSDGVGVEPVLRHLAELPRWFEEETSNEIDNTFNPPRLQKTFIHQSTCPE